MKLQIEKCKLRSWLPWDGNHAPLSLRGYLGNFAAGCLEKCRTWFRGFAGRVCPETCLRLVAPHLRLGKCSMAWLVGSSDGGH